MNITPIQVGTASANAAHAADLGKLVLQGGKWYRVVKAEGAIAAAAKKVVATLLSSGAPTWVVDLAGTTGASVLTPAGVVPEGQVGSTGGTGLVAGDYFLVQVSGPCKVVSAGTFAAGDLIGATGTAGKVDTVSTAAAVGYACEAASAADADTDAILRGLM